MFMTRLLEFYRGESTDTAGRFLKDLWEWEDEDLEICHDVIQWLFPLPDPSQFNWNAPLLTEEDIAAFRDNPSLQTNLRTSYERILTVLGLARTADGTLVEGSNFSARVADAWSAPNHNWLRI